MFGKVAFLCPLSVNSGGGLNSVQEAFTRPSGSIQPGSEPILQTVAFRTGEYYAEC